MKVAITGGTGFVGRNLARELLARGHEVVLVSRGADTRDASIRSEAGVHFVPIGLGDAGRLTDAFHGCDAVAHLAGINRELGEQTYANVHVQGTANVVQAARKTGVRKLILLSFLRARPNCGSPYHESKWVAEELVRASGLNYTIFKAGVIYGRGDHMLDHISHALHTFPVFLLVGFRPTPMRPLAVEDLASLMAKSILDGALQNSTVPVTGPEEMSLREVARRIGEVCGKPRIILPAPVWLHYAMAWVFERTMAIPLAAKAQVRILSESLAEPAFAPDTLPAELEPETRFTEAQIRLGLPEPAKFGLKDCLRRSAAGC
ncbi:MAG TPA: NAD-dependent epimerase/dehydratase family protein [Fimbriimonadaceae bacterium]|nr:NAD-dependent epimerase/dehydratase family protein [Fimbriimonadaceae bacterium]